MINPDRSKLVEGRTYYYYSLQFGYGYNFSRITDKRPIKKVEAHYINNRWLFTEPGEPNKTVLDYSYYYYSGKIAEEYDEAVQDWNNTVKKQYEKFKKYAERCEKIILDCKLPDSLPE